MPENDDVPVGGSPPPVPVAPPPVISAPPPLGTIQPLLAAPANSKSAWRQLIAVWLSLCLGLFLVDAVLSLVDESLALFLDVHFFSAVRGLVALLVLFVAFLTYVLIGFAPMIPKRFFLPLTLFNPLATLLFIPFLIYHYASAQWGVWIISVAQVVLGLVILHRVQGGLKFRWPLVAESHLAARGFSWRNFCVFLAVNLFVLLPASLIYLGVCTAVAVGHFSEGFMAMRPGGISVQARKYVREDGKTIQLFPMSHIAEQEFYRTMSQSFTSNSVILMEGVSDDQDLITNKITYQRMAQAVHVAEQQKEFKPAEGEMVRADVDVADFTRSTIDFLNVVMLAHSKGLNPATVLQLLQYKPPPHFEQQLWDDLLRKRNRHLLGEIETRLKEPGPIFVPWGVAHMPGVAQEIQKLGFQLQETREYVVFRFRPAAAPGKAAGGAESGETRK